jgi:hypothetical protein
MAVICTGMLFCVATATTTGTGLFAGGFFFGEQAFINTAAVHSKSTQQTMILLINLFIIVT